MYTYMNISARVKHIRPHTGLKKKKDWSHIYYNIFHENEKKKKIFINWDTLMYLEIFICYKNYLQQKLYAIYLYCIYSIEYLIVV